MSHSTSENTTPTPDEHSEGLLPAFTAKQYSHLPTPQSPNTLGRYIYDRQHSPESPIPNGTASASSSNFQSRRTGNKSSTVEENSTRSQTNSQQCVTPESSPHFTPNTPIDHNNPATPRYFIPSSSNDFTTPKQNSVRLDFPAPQSISASALPRMSTPSSPPIEHVPHSLALSSPFMAKLSIGERSFDIRPTQVNDIFSPSHPSSQMGTSSSISTPPISPFPIQQAEPAPVTTAGGEMERIRKSMMADRLAQIQEAEKHRPDYLKRTKRSLSEADPMHSFEDDDTAERVLPVGIMESPHKGRRLKLFQETSEESFEESLMAGGYGRYRTADWVRQPQPIALPSTAVAGSSTIVSMLEKAEEAPPTEKELKKRKRLAAFRSSNTHHSNLCAVEFIGKGRVLIDNPPEDQISPTSPEPTPSKKKTPNRRKKKANDTVVNKKLPGIPEQHPLEKPNWPDTEFPWRLRTEERLELAKAEEEERLHWIERFLDRDSDDEDELEHPNPSIDSSINIYEPPPIAPRPGRGKMVPLTAYHDPTFADNSPRRNTFPTDPADARAALLSKRSVRAFCYRQQRRQREVDDEDDDEVVCICNGKDDGRELVQCDACQTWYHLECIGIKNIAELGREEDPWFCRRCVTRSRSPSTEPEVSTGEPTFVPTDEEHSFRRSSDTPFFQPGPQDSPHWSAMKTPRTPTREYRTLSDSHSSWLEPSRPGPSTPQHSASSVRIYSSPYTGYAASDDSPFDPTSTPSRGIKFNAAPFVTPKSNGWSSRGIFQSPTRAPASRGSATKTDSLHPAKEDHGGTQYLSNAEFYGRPNPFDESPIRRADHNPPTHRIISSPSRQRQAGTTFTFLEESPVMRSLGTRIPREPVPRRGPVDHEI